MCQAAITFPRTWDDGPHCPPPPPPTHRAAAAAAAYPPQDGAELASAAESLAISCEVLCDECPRAPGAAAAAAGGESPLQAALQAVQLAHAQLAEVLGG